MHYLFYFFSPVHNTKYALLASCLVKFFIVVYWHNARFDMPPLQVDVYLLRVDIFSTLYTLAVRKPVQWCILQWEGFPSSRTQCVSGLMKGACKNKRQSHSSVSSSWLPVEKTEHSRPIIPVLYLEQTSNLSLTTFWWIK